MMSTFARTVDINQAGRDLVVGDVHGCFRTLDRALSELEFDPSSDRLFGVGDLVNRGPHSEEALTWLESRFDAVTMGNHERPVLDWMLAKVLGSRERAQGWLRKVNRVDYERWYAALLNMPLALTIETPYGAVGVIHAQVPDPNWDRALEGLSSGSAGIADIALLGFETEEEEARVRARPVEGLRALVHGHWPVKEVKTTFNRWNIDTGTGLEHLNRLSLLEVNGSALHSWTFDVDES
ncbi:MAG: metallophosphoesterase [Immundisolibacterales bacterium]|nr:metallophosphoesterase [Immundisolibacterales bacterium]